MFYDKQNVCKAMENWHDSLIAAGLPAWNELPSIDLYMDQVITLMERYLYAAIASGEQEKLVTASIINNYVRMKIIPSPLKKRYSRIHLAYLLMICILKQSFSIASIQKMIPLNLSDPEIQGVYEDFVCQYKGATVSYAEHMRQNAVMLASITKAHEHEVSQFVMASAIEVNLSRIVTEKIIGLQIETAPDED